MKKVLFITTLLLFWNFGQSQEDFLNPPELGDGWTTLSAKEAGLNTSLLQTLSDKIDSGHYVNIHSVLIIKNGKLLMEKYAGDFDRDTKHQMRSISNSLPPHYWELPLTMA